MILAKAERHTKVLRTVIIVVSIIIGMTSSDVMVSPETMNSQTIQE